MEGQHRMKEERGIPGALSLAGKEGAEVSEKEGISVIAVESQEKGLRVAKDILYLLTRQNSNSLLYLSGGSTPKSLYEQLAKEQKLEVDTVVMIDERYDPTDEKTNERMIRETGLINDLESRGIKFFPILDRTVMKCSPNGVSQAGRHMELWEYFAENYDRRLERWRENRKLTPAVPTADIAILGIGEDGHTAGIAPNREGFRNNIFNWRIDEDSFSGPDYTSFEDPKGMSDGGFGARITITFRRLSAMDFLIILAFGSAKQKALKKMFEKYPLEEIPARFYTMPRIAKKTILITDQKI